MITREFNLYLHAGHSIPLVINVNQYDSGETWVFTLFNSDGTQYIPSSGDIVGIKSDNLGIINAGAVDGLGRVLIDETEQMTAAVGKAVFELVIDEGTHGTANFVVLVEPKPGDNADLSETDISMIEQAIEAASTIKPYGSPLVASTVAGMTDHEKVYVYVGSETGYTSGNWYYWDGSAWTSGGVYNSVAVQTDTTLTLSGVAADAKKTGDEISDLKSQIAQKSGLSADVKQAIMDVAEHIGAWTDSNAQTYIENLRTALYPPANLVSITAVYTQSGTVYDNQALDSLKSDLVVTANYDNGTSETVTNYTLSGELTTGESTITVAFGGKTATFAVTVTHAVAQYTILNLLTNCTNSNSATVVNEETEYSATLTADTGYVISAVTITMGNVNITSTAYDSSDGSISITEVTGNVVITAEAIEDLGWVSGTPYTLEWTAGQTVNTSSGAAEASSSYSVTDYLPCKKATAILYARSASQGMVRCFYDENKEFIGGASTYYADGSAGGHVIVPDNAHYVRLATQTSTKAGVTATPYLYPTLDDATVWESGQIYRFKGYDQLMFCYGATSVKMIVDASVYGIRGYYSLFDAAKQKTNNMGNTNNFNLAQITVGDSYYFSLSSTSGTTILVQLT